MYVPNPQGLHKKRGSYLTRGNQSLVRLAKITSSVPDDENNIVKKKGNFVFSAVDPSPEQVDEPKSQTESPKPSSKVSNSQARSGSIPGRYTKKEFLFYKWRKWVVTWMWVTTSVTSDS